MKLLMITGDRQLAHGKRGPFWNTISEFHKHWERIDIITPCIPIHRREMTVFGNVHLYPSPFPLIFQPLWIWWKGKQILKANNYQLSNKSYLMTVHSYPPFYNDKGAWLLHKNTKIPYVLEVLHIPGVPRASNAKEWFYRILVRLFFRFWEKSAKAVRIMNNHETPEYLIRSGVSRSKLVYIPAIYIDFDIFKPLDTPKKYDLIFIGRLAENKGLKRFMEVAMKTKLKALVVGEGPLMNWAKEYAKKHSIDAVFHGFAKDQYEVSKLINSAKLLLMLSDNEGGPRVVPEALASGTPVLATSVGIVPDILPPDAIVGWNVVELADRVSNILNNTQLYAHLREKGLIASSGFEKRTTIKNYAEKLKEIIGSKE